jgi:response regulator of citrate/malate metabolism
VVHSIKNDQLTVLLVDVNREFRKRISELIKDRPASGTLGLPWTTKKVVKFFKNEKPYINLLDIHLPGKNGIELLKYISDRKGLPNEDDDKPGR